MKHNQMAALAYAEQIQTKLAGAGIRCDLIQNGKIQIRSAMPKPQVEDQLVSLVPNCEWELEETKKGTKGEIRFIDFSE